MKRVSSAVLALLAAHAAADTFTFPPASLQPAGTNALTFEFDAATFRLVNATTCINLGDLCHGFLSQPTDLWQLNLSSAPGNLLVTTATLSSSSPCAQRSHDVATGGAGAGAWAALALRWLQVRVPSSSSTTIDVEVTVNATLATGATAWRAAANLSSPALRVGSFTLPNLRRCVTFRDERDVVFVPDFFGHAGECGGAADMGACSADPARHRVHHDEYTWMPNGNERAMGYMAFYRADGGRDGGPGLYLGFHDPRGALKMLLVAARRNATDDASALLVHHGGHQRGAAFALPYAVVLAPFSGDWYDASLIYRGWALAEAAWTRKGPLAARGDVPAWLLATPLWLLSLSHAPDDAPATVAATMRAFQSRALANASSFGLHWYRWNTQLFDVDYPVYTARPGFGDAVASLRRNATGAGGPPPIYSVPYVNGRLFDMALPGWKDGGADGAARRAACHAPGWAPYEEVYSTSIVNRTFAVMDPSSTFWQNTFASIAEGLRANVSALAGLYLDQISSYYPQTCFGQHNESDPFAWAEGERKLLRAAQGSDDDFVVISESNADVYLDSTVNLALYGFLRTCNFVPAFQAVFSGYTVNVGTMGWPSDFAGPLLEPALRSVRGILALQLTYGHVLGWFDVGPHGDTAKYLQRSAPDLAFFRALVAFRARDRIRDYLVLGRMLRPVAPAPAPAPAVPTRSVCVSGFEGRCCDVSAVLASAWEAPDGSVAVAIVNFDTVAHAFAARVAETGASVKLDAAARSVQLVDAGRRPPPAHQQPVVV